MQGICFPRAFWRRHLLAVCLIGSVILASFTTNAAPVITGVSPTFGSPGTSVQITGTDLGTTLEVQFGDGLAVFSVISSTLVIATVPLDATSKPITLTAGTGFTQTIGSFLVTPRISDFLPERAPIGATIRIFGDNFVGATAVSFNGTNAQFSVTSATQIEAIVPVGATSGPVRITTPVGATLSDFPFIVTGKEPFIASFSPSRGAPGTRVMISGASFSAPLTVRFHGTNAPNVSVPSATQIQVTVPASAASGLITVSNAFGVGTSLEPFIVTTAPVIDDFSPIGGPAGTDVVINGANFIGATSVKFGGKAATGISVVAATQMHATVPAGATNGPITITTPQGTGTSVQPFYAGAAPIIGNFEPTNGLPGSQVTINGLNFAGTKSVKLNGTNIAFAVVAPTQINGTIPPNGSSGFLTVSNAAGSATSFDRFLVRTGKPIITGFDPEAGPVRTTVILEGLDLAGATSVRFNGVPAVFSAVGPTQISALVPQAATSGPISVTTPTGTVVSSLRFIVAPGISSFTPTSGIVGSVVTIRGTNFADLLAVRFREVLAPFEIVATNEVRTTVPLEAVSSTINLISPAGIVGATNAFLVLPAINGFSPGSGPVGTAVTISGTGFADVTGVRFGAANAVVFSVPSSTQIIAIVPNGATTGSITVRTLSGTAQSASPFTVGTAADLAIDQSQSTNAVLQSQVLTYTVVVTNHGPATATGVVLSNTLPENVAVLSTTNSRGSLTRDGSDIRVALGTLTNGASAKVIITVLPTATGGLTNLAAIHANEVDPDSGNNVSALVATVLGNSGVLQIQELGDGNFRISWPAAMGDFAVEFTVAFSSRTVWQTLGITPVVSGDQKIVTLPIAGQNRFYRLKRL